MEKPRIPELDGIRGLAILLVLVWHCVAMPMLQSTHLITQFCGRLLMFTWSGVDLFFVLSGFLIGGILIDSKGKEGYFSTFYVRRFFRIVPLYAVVCLSYFPLALLVRFAFHGKLAAMPWYSYATFTQNLWLNNGRWGAYLVQSWSLAVEEQFYLTLPLLIWFLPRKNLWKFALAGIAGVLGFRFSLNALFHAKAATAIYVMLPSRADSLLMGLLAAIAMRSSAAQNWIQENRAWLYTVLLAWVGVLSVLMTKRAGVFSDAMSTFGYSGFGLFYVSLLLLTLTSQSHLRRGFSHPFLRWMGTIAYGVYLFQLPVFEIAAATLRYRPIAVAAVSMAASLALAHISWKLYESGMIAIGHQYRAKKTEQPVQAHDTLTAVCEVE